MFGNPIIDTDYATEHYAYFIVTFNIDTLNNELRYEFVITTIEMTLIPNWCKI